MPTTTIPPGPMLANPLADPLFWPTATVLGGILLAGLLLLLIVERRHLHELPQRTLTVQLVDAHSQQPLSNQEYPLPCLGSRVSVEVLLPISAVNKAIGARIVGCELQTEAPLLVHS